MSTPSTTARERSFTKDEDGAIRVGGTRIPLERVVFEWNAGASPEGIVESYPVLDLGDVYAAIAYYLQHRDEIDAYMRERAEQADRVRREVEQRSPQSGLRQRLLARLNR